jgi:hypothetical protein
LVQDANSHLASYGGRSIEYLYINRTTWRFQRHAAPQVPKHAWASGAVRMVTNEAHGIKQLQPTIFHSLLDLPGAIERELIRAGVKLHASHLNKLTPDAPVTKAARAAIARQALGKPA